MIPLEIIYLVLDKKNANYVTHKECKTSQMRCIRFIKKMYL